MTNMPLRPIEIFYSYAHADERLRNLLEQHLSSLRREGLITNWHDRQIIAGTDWAHTIDAHLNSASVILLLVSPDFMNSDYCYGIEMQRAMERHLSRSALVIPIILRPVDWQHAPFARLQALPMGARPITDWTNRDKAFLDVATGIRHAVEELPAYLSATAPLRDITRLPGKATSYFVSLQDYLKEPSKQGRHRFPVESDFAQHLIYLPETYSSRVQALLQEMRRALLVGGSAAGKTVLAIALGKYLYEEEHYAVAYKNVAKARDGEGVIWHELALAHDQPGTLYILDNCHLASEVVNEFCFQWEGRPPEHTQCILISRPGTQDPEAQIETIRDYFESCAGETIEVHPQDIYRGMLERYAAVYQQQDPARYVALEDDSAPLLQKQHAHNLVISKSRLDAWRESGGRLSMVKEEAVYQALREKYLSLSKVALPILCVLRQYEIPAHNLFVETKLPQEEISQLEQDQLLTSTAVAHYGVLYDLRFHPAEAREIFKSYIYRQHGQITSKQLADGIAAILRAYLSARPSNYLAVYQALYTDAWHQKQKSILERFLMDRELQDCAAYHFETGSMADTLRYIYRLTRFDPVRARELLSTVELQLSLRGICAKIVAYPFQHISVMLDCLHEIDTQVARRVVDALDLQYLASITKAQSLQSLFTLVQAFKRISPAQAHAFLSPIPLETWIHMATANNIVSMVSKLQKLDPAFPQEQFAAALDMGQLVQQSIRASLSLQRLSKLLRVLKAISPAQAKALLAGIPMYILVHKANKSDISSIEKIIGYMQDFGFSPGLIQGFVEALDIEQIIRRAGTENLQHLYWLLRACQKASPAKALAVVEKITPAGLASMCRTKEPTLADIRQFRKVLPKNFWWRFLREFSSLELAHACNRATLGALGSLIQHEYPSLGRGYLLFQKLFLKDRLSTEPLGEIGKFLHRLQSIPQRGEVLAQNALALLATTELTDRVASADLEQYALLLHHAYDIDESDAAQLLAPLYKSETLQAALARSSIHGIQMLIHNIALHDTTGDGNALQIVQEGVRLTSLSEALERAELKDLGRFLWNVYVHIDPSLAQGYCQLVDGQPRSSALESADLDDLCLFLWNLASISSLPTLSTFDDPILKQRLAQAWRTDIGLGATLLGTIAVARSTTDLSEVLSSMRGRQEQLATYLKMCLVEQSPYTLALTLSGLRIYNEEVAKTIIRRHLSIEEMLRVLLSAQREARTARSRTLLSETVTWLMKRTVD